ncbi:probable purine permease 10 isoform X2 [Durio zibethinus]|uniref:Probable purine permease n=1 Tax=Durio zibethinus TaxID=66656 RepID=A0A6P6BJJ6_DURZI|nr:probable purine permease 10 isoform X2 [Durio zibethinus]
MPETQQLQPHIMANGANSSLGPVSERTVLRPHQIRWLRIVLYIIFGNCGQVSATLLTRLYYAKGGTSKWVGTLVQVVGFPILLPYYFISQRKGITPTGTADVETKPSSLLLLFCVYIYLGLLMAGNGYLFSVGLEYLPVSTVALISASQLAFNAFFSYFLNSQKLTPFIINSLVLLTISSILLVANNNYERPPGVSDGKYVIGFICTIFGTATNGLSLASQQLAFRKVLKKQSLKVVMDLVIYESLVASIATSIGFLASGEWKGVKREMEGYALGNTSYVMILVWTAVAWQVAIFCGVALVFELSALFANVIAAVGLPIAPITAMLFFHDKMSVIKGIAMVLAVWGFLSYVYQQYLDDRDLNAETKNGSEISET